MNKGKTSMSIQWSTEKLKQWRGKIEGENVFSFDMRYSTLLWVTYDQRYYHKPEKNWQNYFIYKLQIWHFLKSQILSFFIIFLVTFDVQECIVPQFKAKDILFGPYFLRFLARVDVLWERKCWSCLFFFRTLQCHYHLSHK